MPFIGGTRSLANWGVHCILATALISLLCGCDPQNLYNTESQQQNTAAGQAKEASLQPAVANFCGTLHISSSDEDFDVKLRLWIIEENEHSSSSTDPTDTVEVPKLAGSVIFPAIQSQGDAAYSTLPDLMVLTGQHQGVSISYGDYNPITRFLSLPYTVAGQPGGAAGDQANYGSLTGTLDGDVFSGTWQTENSQDVDPFTFSKCGGSK